MRLQPLGEESTDGIQRLCCRLQLSDVRGNPVWHPHPHINPGIDCQVEPRGARAASAMQFVRDLRNLAALVAPSD